MPPSDADLRSLGLVRSDLDVAAIELWPEVDLAVEVFDKMRTQWRVGANGATGLDYSVLPFVLRMVRVPRSGWPDVFDDLRVIENASLDEIHKGKQK